MKNSLLECSHSDVEKVISTLAPWLTHKNSSPHTVGNKWVMQIDMNLSQTQIYLNQTFKKVSNLNCNDESHETVIGI